MPRDSLCGFAFFDVDDTLISIKSMFSFQDYWYAVTGDRQGQVRFEEEITRLFKQDASWEVLNRRYYAHFAGRPLAELERRGEEWFDHLERTNERLYHTAIVARLRDHQAAGEEVVFVSGSFPALLSPVARRLGVRHILSTTLAVVDGVCTGEILPPQTVGEGKAVAVAGFLERAGMSAELCHAYGDDISDLPMLSAVGHPFAVSGGRGLEAHAKTVGWPVLSPY